jgi:hypothetical protein
MSLTGSAVLTVNTHPSAPVSGGNQSYCSNQSIPALKVIVGTGVTADWYAASSGATALAIGTMSYTPSSAGTFYAEARNTTTGCLSTTRTAVTLTMNGTLPVSVSIAASANPVFAGTSVTFTATPANGSSAPVYQWKVNGVNVGTNSATYSYTPANNDLVTCELTSNATCATGNPATSNTITMMVNPLVSASVSNSSPVAGIFNVYPNPGNGPIRFDFNSSREGKVTLDLLNVMGKMLMCLFDGNLQAGEVYTVIFDKYLPEGTYIYRMTSMDGVKTGKLIRMR